VPRKKLNHEPATPRKGRGAGVNPASRFEHVVREVFDDSWHHESGKALLKKLDVNATCCVEAT